VGNDHNIFVNGLAPNQIFYAIPSPLFSAAAELAALKHPRRPTQSGALAWRRLYGEETVRKAERAWFLSEGEGSEALNRVAFFSLGQKKRVLELYRLSLSSMVASSIPEYFLMMYKKNRTVPRLLR